MLELVRKLCCQAGFKSRPEQQVSLQITGITLMPGKWKQADGIAVENNFCLIEIFMICKGKTVNLCMLDAFVGRKQCRCKVVKLDNASEESKPAELI